MSACDHDGHEEHDDSSRIGKSHWRSKEYAINKAVKEKLFGYDTHEEFAKMIAHGATPGSGHVDTLNNHIYDGNEGMGDVVVGSASPPCEA